VVEYGREFQARAAEELALLPQGSALAEMQPSLCDGTRHASMIRGFVKCISSWVL
jgi:hypothetical protein